jgi:hypothetical protein
MSASHLQSAFWIKSFQNEKLNIKKAAPSRYGLYVSRKVSFPKNPTETPKATNTAGPMQHEAARNEAMTVPRLEMFSIFILVHPSNATA